MAPVSAPLGAEVVLVVVVVMVVVVVVAVVVVVVVAVVVVVVVVGAVVVVVVVLVEEIPSYRRTFSGTRLYKVWRDSRVPCPGLFLGFL